MGNRESNRIYEKCVPLSYRRPKPNDPEYELQTNESLIFKTDFTLNLLPETEIVA